MVTLTAVIPGVVPSERRTANVPVWVFPVVELPPPLPPPHPDAVIPITVAMKMSTGQSRCDFFRFDFIGSPEFRDSQTLVSHFDDERRFGPVTLSQYLV